MLTEKITMSTETKNKDPIYVLNEMERKLNGQISKLNRLQQYGGGVYAMDIKKWKRTYNNLRREQQKIEVVSIN